MKNITLKEFINIVNNLISESPLHEFMAAGLPEYRPDMGWVHFILNFKLPNREQVEILGDLKTDYRNSEREERDGKVVKIVPYVEEDEIKIHWNTLTNRSITESEEVLAHYMEAVKLGKKIQEVINTSNVRDEYYEMPEPPRPSELDKFVAGYMDFKYASKKELVEKCREYDLKVSGNKDELMERIKSYAKEVGRPKVAAEYFTWQRNSVKEIPS